MNPPPKPWNPVLDRRRFLLASLGGAATLALAGCRPGRQGGTGPTVRTPLGATGFPSPFAANADIGYTQMSLIYDTLLWKDGDGNLLHWLAEGVTSTPDHAVNTFQLRENVAWSDGRPFTADDVVFTFDYYARQGSLSPPVIIQPPAGIAKVTALAPQTVEIRLDPPVVTFEEMVAGALPIVPRHVWETIEDPGAVQDKKVLVGTGPYRLVSYRGDGDPLLYEARPDFFLGNPYIQRIEERAIADDAQYAALVSGDTDEARGVGLRADLLAPFQNDPRFGMVTDQGTQASVLYWNLGKEGPLADLRFRQALAMAIDRQELVDRLANGRGLPGNPGFLSPRNAWFAPVRQYDFDVAGANALLDSAGYRPGPGGVRQAPSGAPLDYELLVATADVPLSEILVASARRIGVTLRPKAVEVGPQLFGAKLVGKYDMAVLFFPGPGPGGPNGDPDILRLLFSSEVGPSLQSATVYVNPAFDALASRQRAEFDKEARRATVAQMQAILADDLPVLPLFYPEVAILFRTTPLDNWYFTPGQFPSSYDNKQLFVTGNRAGTTIRTR